MRNIYKIETGKNHQSVINTYYNNKVLVINIENYSFGDRVMLLLKTIEFLEYEHIHVNNEFSDELSDE